MPDGVLSKYGPGIGYRFPPDEKYTNQFVQFNDALANRYAGNTDREEKDEKERREEEIIRRRRRGRRAERQIERRGSDKEERDEKERRRGVIKRLFQKERSRKTRIGLNSSDISCFYSV